MTKAIRLSDLSFIVTRTFEIVELGADQPILLNNNASVVQFEEKLTIEASILYKIHAFKLYIGV
jgi:hypothetical protein